ncbi:MAG: hypothetical protein C4523_08430 [Myxococcales bacterium]|nr:MAG: hypothetical protein C4523_08430 [Myxococcales bacterium]
MSLAETFDARLKDAMLRKDARDLAVLRMIKSRYQLKLTEPGVHGALTDEMAVEIISTYVKQLQKAIPDFEKAGERGRDKLAQIRYEIEYLEQFLPKMLSEAETEALVRQKIAELGLKTPNEAGKLMGALMKDYRGKVDPGLAKAMATKLLAATT